MRSFGSPLVLVWLWLFCTPALGADPIAPGSYFDSSGRDDVLAGGVSVSMSFGVSASEQGETFDYESLFAKADAALYQAKQNGRDQICLAGSGALAALV